MNEKFIPLLFGGDINVYSVARAFHEAYKVKSVCYGKYNSGPALRSKIINYIANENIEKAEVFRDIVISFANSHKDYKVFVIGCGDAYVQLASENKEYFPDNCIIPYIKPNLLNTLIHKEKFYALCDKYDIPHPDTFIYTPSMGHDFTVPFKTPFILKPSNSITYWEHPFPGNNKVFIINSRKELLNILDKCYGAGYPDSMIIQDMIPGDDSYMGVLTNYSDKKGKVKMMCLGHVLLEEHTPHGLGNHAVILTEKNEKLSYKIKNFLEDIGYIGFSNFDLKYDMRDNTYKAFEINCRQGRSNYYVTGAGFNIATYLVNDYIKNKEMDFKICDNETLWRVVPKSVSYDYIISKYHPKMKELEKEGKVSNSLLYSFDNRFIRKLWTFKNLHSHFKKFKIYYEKKS